jgi:hypothetical protein
MSASLAIVLAIAIAAHPTPAPTSSAATLRTLDARNEAAYLVWRCANDHGFRARHKERCRIARAEK